jgi:hypothetical protein
LAKRLLPKPKRGHKEAELAVLANDGSEFLLIIRQSVSNALDFSVILAYRHPAAGNVVILRRYNGKSHQHTNPIEGSQLYDFHIHTITERYQNSSFRRETFAETTNRYGDLDGAVRCLIMDCGFSLPADAQKTLFTF